MFSFQKNKNQSQFIVVKLEYWADSRILSDCLQLNKVPAKHCAGTLLGFFQNYLGDRNLVLLRDSTDICVSLGIVEICETCKQCGSKV